MESDTPQSPSIRDQARSRITARRGFWRQVVLYLVVTVVLVGIWAVTGGPSSYFWPAWPMAGFALALIIQALFTFGPMSRPITDAHIDEEVRKMGGAG